MSSFSLIRTISLSLFNNNNFDISYSRKKELTNDFNILYTNIKGRVAHEMTDFQRNMQYIKSVDENYYNMRVSILDKNSAFFLGDYQV